MSLHLPAERKIAVLPAGGLAMLQKDRKSKQVRGLGELLSKLSDAERYVLACIRDGEPLGQMHRRCLWLLAERGEQVTL